MKRKIIYFFYDTEGIADRYVLYALEKLSEVCDYLQVVANGPIKPQARKAFLKITPHLTIRGNKGFDAWAFKEALEGAGWDGIR